MNVILLSIKPEYVSKIFSGEKQYEYRKWLIKNPIGLKVVIYSSAPVQEIVGEFTVDDVICQSPENIWNNTSNVGGIEMEKFFSYFDSNSVGYAYRIENLRKFNKKYKLEDIGIKYPPQKYCYLTEQQYLFIQNNQ